jgi:hypothetical protein
MLKETFPKLRELSGASTIRLFMSIKMECRRRHLPQQPVVLERL